MQAERRIVLASGSRIRRELLESAGVDVEVVPASIDEDAVKRELLAGAKPLSPRDLAVALARAKAADVASRCAGSIVIGADQVLELEGATLSKPPDLNSAAAHLRRLRGKEHRLHAAVVLLEDDGCVFDTVDTARLFMRDFSDEFLKRYLEAAGARVCHSVGAYEFEGLGLHLFDRIEGDYYTILGLPMLPLMSALRAQKVILS